MTEAQKILELEGFKEKYRNLSNILVGGNGRSASAVSVQRRALIRTALYDLRLNHDMEKALNLEKDINEALNLCPYGLLNFNPDAKPNPDTDTEPKSSSSTVRKSVVAIRAESHPATQKTFWVALYSDGSQEDICLADRYSREEQYTEYAQLRNAVSRILRSNERLSEEKLKELVGMTARGILTRSIPTAACLPVASPRGAHQERDDIMTTRGDLPTNVDMDLRLNLGATLKVKALKDLCAYDLIANNISCITNQERDNTMSIITNITFIDGVPAKDKTNDQIYAIIQRLEARIKSFEGMRKKPLALKSELAELDKTIDQLIMLVDDREALITQDKPTLPQIAPK